MSITLSDLKQRTKERCDIVNSQFISDSEMTTYVNSSLGELYDLLVSNCENYFLSGTAFAITTGTDKYDLPTGTYRVIGIDILDSNSDVYSLTKFNFNERNRFANTDTRLDLYSATPLLRYSIVGNQIWVKPSPKENYTATIYTIPQMTLLTGSADAISNQIVESWAEYVVIDCAIKIKNKSEEDSSPFIYEKKAITERIKLLSQDRDNQPDYVYDVNSMNDLYWTK